MFQSLLVLIVKNEENDILEWICHHALIGFEKIVIYDNESTDRTSEIIKYASRYFPVDYVLWKDGMHPIKGLTKQGAAYTHAIKKYRDSAEWMCFLDADEFLIPPKDENLNDLLNQMSGSKGFALNWMTFGSSNLEDSKERLVLEAYTLRGADTENINRHVKMFFKTAFAKKVVNPHFVDVGEPIVNLDNKIIQWSSDGIVASNAILQAKWRIHHYIIRSREHWQRRIARKQPGGSVREWSIFQDYDQNDILDYTAYDAAQKVWDKLSQLGQNYKPLSAIPSTYDGPVQISSNILCFLDEVNANEIKGWACDVLVDEPVNLSIYIDRKLVGSLQCNKSRSDVKKSKINKEFVGFSYKLPTHYLDGQKHIIMIRDQHDYYIKFYVNGKKVKEHPFEIAFQPRVIGHVDDPINGNLRGWVSIARDCSYANFETKCHVLICLGHRPIASVLADEPRKDVYDAHGIDLYSGFSYSIPTELRDGTDKVYRFYLLPEMIELPGSPALFGVALNDQIDKIVSVANKIKDIDRHLEKIKIKDNILTEAIQHALRNVEEVLPYDGGTVLNYASWFYQHHLELHKKIKTTSLKVRPLVSVVCPVYRPVLKDFQAAVYSVLNQTYKNIELILCDDGGGDSIIVAEIKKIAKKDSRVKYIIAEKNRGISEATNACLDLAQGEWIAFFDHDDVLVDCAIERMLAFDPHNQVNILYSDEDKIDDDGIISDPMFKPEWNYRYLLGCNYINHLTMVRRTLVQQVGYLDTQYNGAQDHDFLLRCIELVQPHQIVHVPEILYHWRKTATSTASSTETKPYVIGAGIKAVSDHLSRLNVKATVDSYGKHSMYHITASVEPNQSVAIIIPFKDQVHFTQKCVEHVLKYTKRHNIQIVLVNNNSKEQETLLYLEKISKNEKVKIINYPYAFNYSKINNLAVKRTSSDYIVFLNNDLFVQDELWLDTMLGEMVIDANVGAVGGKFLYQNRMIQHCGVVLGWMGVAGHAFSHESEFYPGYGARAWLPHQVSAVTAACMLVPRKVFEEVGGFDAKTLKVAFNDIDLCLKITQLGYKIIITPDFVAEHHESLSRGLDDTKEKLVRFEKEVKVMRKRWGKLLDNDPFYSPSFARQGKPYFDLIPFDKNQ